LNRIDLAVSRRIPAPAEQVFDRWIDPRAAGGPWFGARQVLLNPEVDGLFYSSVHHKGRACSHYGRFLRIERPACLEFTWVSEATQGLETTVIVTFESRGAETLVTLRHAGVPDDAEGMRHKEGWAWVLSTLEQSFCARTETSAPA